MNTRLLTRSIRQFVLATSICALVPAASADTATWNGGTGIWESAANWSPGIIPNNTGPTTYDVFIDGGKAVNSIVTITAGPPGSIINNLTIDLGDELVIGPGAALTIGDGPGAGTLSNSGELSFAFSGYATELRISGEVTFNGSGTINGSGTGSVILDGGAWIHGIANTDLLTNSAGHTIEGRGVIGSGQLLLTNRGIITANLGPLLHLDTTGDAGAVAPGLINSGLMQAVNGSTLQFYTEYVENSEGGAAGTISAGPGSLVNIVTSLITGGNLETVGTGEIRLNGPTRITGGTLTTSVGGIVRNLAHSADSTLGGTVNNVAGGLILVENGSGMTLEGGGTYNNHGVLQLNGGAFATELRMAGEVTFNGSGTINGSGTGSVILNGGGRIFGTANTHRLTNSAGHTIEGAGLIGTGTLLLTNRGTITANLDTAITLDTTGDASAGTAGLTNSGLMQAVSGKTLQLLSDWVENSEGGAAGTIRANGAGSDGTRSVVDIVTTRITGGNLETVGTGEIRVSGATKITGGTLTTSPGGIVRNLAGTNDSLLGGTVNNVAGGVILVEGGSLLTLDSGGTYNNHGEIQLPVGSLLRIAGDVTLSGSGSVVANNVYGIFGKAVTDRLTNAAGHTIVGAGQIGANEMALTNNGTMLANLAGGVMTINPSASGTVVNGATGVWRASGSGELSLTDGTFTNNGTVEALSGGNVTFTGSATVMNYNAGTNKLTGGKWWAFAGPSPATITLTDASVQTNAANVLLDGPGSTFTAINALNNNQGSFTITNGRDFTRTGALANSGSLTVGTSSTLTVTGALTQSGGSTILDNGSLTATALNFNGGSLRGTGTATGPVTMSGGALLLPQGLLTINGSATLGDASMASCMASFDLVATTQYDALDVTGTVTFGGTLDVVLFGGFQPQAGDSFDLFNWGSTTGTHFSAVYLPALTNGLVWDQNNLYLDGTLSIAFGVGPTSHTWVGGGADDHINTAGNWNPAGTPPGNLVNTSLVFDGTVRLTPNFSAPFSANSITFNNNAASNAFTFSGSMLTIGAGGIVNNDANTQTFDNPVTVGTATSTFNAASGALAFTGGVDLGTNTLNVSGDLQTTISGGLTGTGILNKNGLGTLMINASATDISADINVYNEELEISGSATQTFSRTSTITIGGGTLLQAFLFLNANTILDGGAQLVVNEGSFSISSVFLQDGKTLTIRGGSDFISNSSYLVQVWANIVVTGAGSTFQSTNSGIGIHVGGSLFIQNGGTVSTTSDVGVYNGLLLVDGSDSTLTAGDASLWGDYAPVNVTFSNNATASFAGISAGYGDLSTTIIQVLSGADVTNGSHLGLAVFEPEGGSATLTVDGDGSTWTQTGASPTTIGAAANTTGTLTVSEGGAFTSGTGTFDIRATGTVNIDGGTLTINGPLTQNGTFNFTAGTLNLSGPNNLTIGPGGLLGQNLTLLADRTLNVANTTTINAGRTLTLNGGTFTTGVLVKNGILDFQKGTLGITGAGGLNIGTGPLGSSVTLGPDKHLQVTNTATIAGGATVTLDGGTFTTGVLDNSGTLRANIGTASAGSGTNNSGGRIFISDTLDIPGVFTNAAGGRITLEDGTGLLSGTGLLVNSGVLLGDGTVSKPLANGTTGEVRAELGRTLNFTREANNFGQFNLAGGTLDFGAVLDNSATGYISGHGALHTGGLTNYGVMAFSGGTTDIHGTMDIRGDVTNASGARIVTSGAGSTTTFFDDVTHNGIEIRTSAGASTVFFGAVSGAGPYTGTGTAYFEGDLQPGNSPALITFQGNVVLGTLSTVTMEIGGTTRGAQYDAMNVAGNITFGGTLDVAFIGGFQPQPGDSFNFFDWGTTAGTFSAINLPAPGTALEWDQSGLLDGTLSIALDPVVTGRTWDGGGANNDWSTNANWNYNAQPLNNATADLVFGGNARLAPGVDADWNVRSITFDNTAGAFDITGPEAITVGAGGITNNDANTQTISAAITLSADESFTAALGDLSIGEVDLGGHLLTLVGANDVTLGGADGTGTIDNENAGALNITGALGTGGVTLNAITGETYLGDDQTLAALNIGADATVTLGALGALAPASAVAPVPEPGAIGLLAAGLLSLCSRRRRA